MTKMVRVCRCFGRNGLLPLGKTAFYENVVLRDENDPFIPGTKVHRLRLTSIGPNVRVAFEDEIEAIAKALRAERDSKPNQLAEPGRVSLPAERLNRGKTKRLEARAAGEAA